MSSYKIVLENSASCLALSPDFSQVVIAGSHIFKIYSIKESELTEKVNLYAAKNLNPNFSSSDVVWNPIEESKLATVATNGAVVTWDLRKSTRSKLDFVFKDHERPVNKVSFHPLEAPLLISGSQDGLMKLFDTRRKEAVTTFISNAESVRDIQFNPHKSFCFAAGTENGNVQFWDMRKNDRTEHQFTGHRGPVFAIDWHPEYKKWIATASRDHTIKVWDLNEPSSLYNSIRTVASVGRVKWRPNRKYHLASCALAIDCSISVWDIRRPYIPFSAFHEHRDVTSGIAWQGNPNVLLSVGKDNTLYYHSFDDAIHPIENTNPAALDINPQGLISSAKPKDDKTFSVTGSKVPTQKRFTATGDTFGPVFSTVNVFDVDDESPISSHYIVESACNYRLSGRSLIEICEHNATVAKHLHRGEIALTWQMIQILYGGFSATSSDYQTYALKEDPRLESNLDTDQKHVRHFSGDGTGEASGGTGGFSAEEAETETDDTDNHDMKLMHIASGVTVSHDYFFGDDEISQLPFDYDNLNNVDASNEWTLPNEAFQPRRDIIYRSTTPPDEFPSNAPTGTKEDSNHMQITDDMMRLGVSDYVMAASMKLNVVEPESEPSMDFTPLIVDVLHYYASKGDIQMAVTLIIVLGDRIKNLVEESTVEHWFLSYIEILHRLHLWNTATQVIQLASGLPVVQQMNQQSTSVRLQCGSCDNNIPFAKYFCRKCGNAAATCAVCHCVVHGLYVWCQGCSHGGHLSHMLEWIKENPSCPAGCGHLCEYT